MLHKRYPSKCIRSRSLNEEKKKHKVDYWKHETEWQENVQQHQQQQQQQKKKLLCILIKMI